MVPARYDRVVIRRLLAIAAALVLATAAAAQSSRTVRVSVEFRQAATASREGVGAGGGVIVTERGGVRSRVRGGAGSTEIRRQASTGMFTLVQDGGEATLQVATQVPVAQVTILRDYAAARGYVSSTVVFRDVGTALGVRASILPDRQIRVRLTPRISWLSPGGAGTIEFVEAATELVVPDGRPVVLAGSTTATHTVTREILGLGQQTTSDERTVVLIATTTR